MVPESKPSAGSELLEVLGPTDVLAIDDDERLVIDGVVATRLAAEFASPLFVLCEATFRANLRRFSSAFAQVWPSPTSVLYAVKANPNPALCPIAREEGAGFDCTGLGELELALAFGANPEKTTLNGSNKSEIEIHRAVAAGALIVLDAEDDVGVVEKIARHLKREVRVAIRIKAFDADALSHFQSDAYPSAEPTVSQLSRKKWGVGYHSAVKIISGVRRSRYLDLMGFHVHIGRLTRDAQVMVANVGAFADLVGRIKAATGYVPRLVDIGGGWPADRDPEARTRLPNPTSIEDYAKRVCSALSAGLSGAGCALPELWLEPGRYLVNNAGILLTQIGRIKHEDGRTWFNVDASGEWMVLTTQLGAENMIVPIEGLNRPLCQTADVVGPNCVPAVFARDRVLPDLHPGEVVAILDAGAYAESQASQFNSMPRPATLLVSDGSVDLIRRRETLEDLLAHHVVPDRLSQP